MTLLEIAEYLANTQQTLYDRSGRNVLRDVSTYDKFYDSLNRIHNFKGAHEESFFCQSPDDNVTFILLVHECISNI